MNSYRKYTTLMSLPTYLSINTINRESTSLACPKVTLPILYFMTIITVLQGDTGSGLFIGQLLLFRSVCSVWAKLSSVAAAVVAYLTYRCELMFLIYISRSQREISLLFQMSLRLLLHEFVLHTIHCKATPRKKIDLSIFLNSGHFAEITSSYVIRDHIV